MRIDEIEIGMDVESEKILLGYTPNWCQGPVCDIQDELVTLRCRNHKQHSVFADERAKWYVASLHKTENAAQSLESIVASLDKDSAQRLYVMLHDAFDCRIYKR